MGSYITLTYVMTRGLREALRPVHPLIGEQGVLSAAALVLLHEKLLMILVEFETSETQELPLTLTREDCLFISQFLSEQDGDWAKDVLKQSRRALFELKTGILPAWQEDNARIQSLRDSVQGDVQAG